MRQFKKQNKFNPCPPFLYKKVAKKIEISAKNDALAVLTSSFTSVYYSIRCRIWSHLLGTLI